MPGLALPNATPTEMTFPEYKTAYRHFLSFLAQVGWDYSGDLGPTSWGWSTQPRAVNYFYNSVRWALADRMKARSWLVFAAYLLELDTAMPQWSMLGGQPNFAVAYKQILGIGAGLFPLHPHAARWKDTYVKFWDEFLDRYVFKADETTGARAGRFTENISCYNYASMESIGLAATGIMIFDGTQILDRQAFRDWVRWDMECRLPFRTCGARIVPPEGAHAAIYALGPGGRWHEVARATAILLNRTAPQLANEWLWSITDGAQGKKPQLKSCVYRDYGPVFHYDFGGPSEAYLQLQQINGQAYRWSGAGNGALYFAAKGQSWSWNDVETNGDGFDIKRLPALQVGNRSLGACPADAVLYDFDFAQYYRAEAAPGGDYKSRGVIMVRGDYLAVFDTV